MPINADEWEKGRTSDKLESRIEEFLQENKGQAFTVGEIINHLYQFKTENWAGFLLNLGSAFVVQKVLGDMIEKGIVKSKIVEEQIGTDEYYMIS